MGSINAKHDYEQIEKEVLDTLTEGPKAAKAIAESIGKNVKVVKICTTRLIAKGAIKKVGESRYAMYELT
jgi:predicted transcriptional regulator